jgi:membrane-associated PAP2 superfamily phosphatase
LPPFDARRARHDARVDAQSAPGRQTQLTAIAVAFPIVAVLLACVLSVPALDLAIDRWFHHPEGWKLEGTTFANLFYRFGGWPPMIVGGVAALIAIASFAVARLRPLRCAALAAALALVVGPGLIVNLALKEHWGRPRPRDLVEFGGAQQYRPAFSPGPGHFTSFCSGHVAAAGFTCIFFSIWRRRHARLAIAALGVSVAYGALMGLARVGVGAHFPSDAAWAAAVTALVAALVDLVVLRRCVSGTTAADSPSLPTARTAS